MPWKEVTTMSAKKAFIEDYLSLKYSMTRLCEKYDISRPTGYKWVGLYHESGLAGLEERSRAPHNHPNQIPPEIEQCILEIREKYSTFGARKIYNFLQEEHNIDKPPALSTITAILHRNDKIRVTESLKRKKFTRFEREHPNELWQADFKGTFRLQDNTACKPFTLLDDCSRFSLALEANTLETYEATRERFINAFERYGLPKQVNVDNGNPWGSSSRVKHTQFTVWIMHYGVKITHSRPRHPQTNGKLERFHRTFKEDVLAKTIPNDLVHAQMLFDEWRQFYNDKRPHEAIAMKKPSEVYTPSKTKIPKELPSIEYDLQAIIRSVRGNGYIRYNSHEYHIGKAFKDYHVEIKHDESDEKFIDIYFGKVKFLHLHLENSMRKRK